jgi:hypothetical protein
MKFSCSYGEWFSQLSNLDNQWNLSFLGSQDFNLEFKRFSEHIDMYGGVKDWS